MNERKEEKRVTSIARKINLQNVGSMLLAYLWVDILVCIVLAAVMIYGLDVQLAGNAYYFGKLYEKPTIGDPIRPVEIEDIPRANKLLYATCIVGAILFFGLSVLLKTVL